MCFSRWVVKVRIWCAENVEYEIPKGGFVRPFTSGSHYMSWVDHNCLGCTKYDPVNAGACEIDVALGEAYLGDGDVSQEIADRMGARDDTVPELVWNCPELIAITRWG
jgi:hypothetical protein